MRSFERGCALADELGVGPGAELRPVLEHLGLEVEPWRFAGRVREVIVERTIGIDDRLSEPWVRWLTAHAVGHHLLQRARASTSSRGSGSRGSRPSGRPKSSRRGC